MTDAARIITADCLDVLPTLSDQVDAVITDPPYGVGLGKNADKMAYGTFDDTQNYVETVCLPAIKICIERWERVVITPGSRNCYRYPTPQDTGVWFNPAGTSISKWGWNCVNPIYYYGKDPRAGRGITPNGTWAKHGTDEKPSHPCPKPLEFAKWLVEKGSIPGETVLDPFAGSAAFGVACVQLGRKYIGIEINPQYASDARERLDRAMAQGQLYQAIKPEQLTID